MCLRHACVVCRGGGGGGGRGVSWEGTICVRRCFVWGVVYDAALQRATIAGGPAGGGGACAERGASDLLDAEVTSKCDKDLARRLVPMIVHCLPSCTALDCIVLLNRTAPANFMCALYFVFLGNPHTPVHCGAVLCISTTNTR